MSNWFNVQVSTIKTYVVEVEDNEGADDAMETVTDSIFGGFHNIEVDKVSKDDVPMLQMLAEETFEL